MVEDLSIIQRTYDLILWYVPRLNKLPRDVKFILGDRIQHTLYEILEGLIRARYQQEKLGLLDAMNAELGVLRYQTRLCKDLGHLDVRRYEHVSRLINEVGEELGGWIRHQRKKQ
ncbi:MAG TPA: diversity-generating retroelement protein Avd [Candidatus Hydrogenedentes bacterium]|nr:diversity-generating retroelement protein Avd [Candidatus Hydrogenedentota bacterium]